VLPPEPVGAVHVTDTVGPAAGGPPLGDDPGLRAMIADTSGAQRPRSVRWLRLYSTVRCEDTGWAEGASIRDRSQEWGGALELPP